MDTKLQINTIKNTQWLAGWTKKFCNATILHRAGIHKRSGIAAAWLIQLFIALPFVDLSVYRLRGTANSLPHRSTFYDFLAHAHYKWRSLIYMVASRVIEELNGLTCTDQDRVLIVDDSPYKRPRSKKVEYLGSQYDHSNQSYYRGFRMNTMVWSDGHTTVPVDFELLSNASAAKRLAAPPSVDRRTQLGRRCRAAVDKATDQTAHMLRRVLRRGIDADYLVADSWYAHPELLHKLNKEIPVVCMLKNSGTIKFRHGEKIYQLKGLYQKVCRRKRKTKSNQHNIVGSLVVQMLSGPTVRVVFVRDHRDPNRWLALASTDLKITPQRVCRIYAKRWAIEVFFKQAKQHLGLASEFQLRSYAGLIAHTSIVMLRYMMLEYYRRQCSDDRTIPGLFHAYVQQMQMLTIHLCTQMVLLEVVAGIVRYGSQQLLDQVAQIIGQFYTNHPWLSALSIEQQGINSNSES